MLICPSSADERATGDTPAEVARDLMTNRGHISYVYRPEAMSASRSATQPANPIIAYDQPENHAGEGIEVLHADCTVEFLPRKAAMGIVQFPMRRN